MQLRSNPPLSSLPPAAMSIDSSIVTTWHGGDLIEVIGSGVWAPDYADTHFRKLSELVRQVRREVGRARVLVDLRRAGVQPQATTALIRSWTARIYQAEDRVAMLVASSLVKAQMRQAAAISTRELFLSEHAARVWLDAGQPIAPPLPRVATAR